MDKKYCNYCHNEILEHENYILDSENNYYHYSEDNPLENCYFPDEEE